MPRTTKVIECSSCDNKIERHSADLCRRKNFFCSKKCLKEFYNRTTKFQCFTCGVDVYRARREVKKSKSGRFYCSKSCCSRQTMSERVGDKHPNWNGGYGSYRTRALRKYGERCMNPGCPLTLMSIHIPRILFDVDHIDNNRKNNSLDNLQVLCVYCHMYKSRSNR